MEKARRAARKESSQAGAEQKGRREGERQEKKMKDPSFVGKETTAFKIIITLLDFSNVFAIVCPFLGLLSQFLSVL